jgi:hypothetical protein
LVAYVNEKSTSFIFCRAHHVTGFTDDLSTNTTFLFKLSERSFCRCFTFLNTTSWQTPSGLAVVVMLDHQ